MRQLPLAIRELRRSRRLRRHLLALAATVAVLTYLGPFGTASRLELADRAAYWSVCIALNWALATAVVPAAMKRLVRAGVPEPVAIAIPALAAAVPGTGIVLAAEWQFGGTAGLGLGYLYSCVAVVFVVLSFLVYRLVERTALDPSPREAVDSADAPFLARLPGRLGRNLLRLQMQDHYVEAHTDKGSELILLRFRDALREVAGLDGMQVHRSHWVARTAVERVVRRNGRLALRLTDGLEVPVSRSFVPAVRKQGWL